MRIVLVVVAVVAGCDQGSSCKDVVVEAQTALALGHDQAETLIGRCEIQAWTGKQRACVREASDVHSLAVCNRGLIDAIVLTERLGTLSELADKMCICRTADCARHVDDEMMVWSEASDRDPEPLAMTDEELMRQDDDLRKLNTCMHSEMEPDNPRPTRR